jgi:glutathione S-transferase
MILYLSPGACSLASHIALNEAGLAFEQVKVDLENHRTAQGDDFAKINPKGYVPALKFDNGEVLTENIAILSWIGDQAEKLPPLDSVSRYRLLESLAYIATEVHKAFKPLFSAQATEGVKATARQAINKRLTFIAERLNQDYLLGPDFTVADAYLFVMLTWARKNGVSIPDPLLLYFERIRTRPAVRRSLEEEKLA